MDRDQTLAFLRGGYRDFLPHVSVDCVVFGFHDGELKVLLLRWKHVERWSLPGGYVRRDESLDEAARRVLRERTGLQDTFLQQFRAFGGTGRGEREGVREIYRLLGLEMPADAWLADRIVSVGYYALVEFAQSSPAPDGVLSDECRWWTVEPRPPLLFDHDEMVERALVALRRELSYHPVGMNLLPERFTMPELQRLYETLLGRPLDRRNFQKRMLESGIVERLSERRRGGAHRAPYLYRFVPERYEALSRDGMSDA